MVRLAAEVSDLLVQTINDFLMINDTRSVSSVKDQERFFL